MRQPAEGRQAPEPVNEKCFGRHGRHNGLSRAYGYDVPTDTTWPLLRDAPEAEDDRGRRSLLSINNPVVAEFKLRLNSVRTGDQGPPSPTSRGEYGACQLLLARPARPKSVVASPDKRRVPGHQGPNPTSELVSNRGPAGERIDSAGD